MIKQLITCESCEAEFYVKNNLDEEYYEIAYCIFYGKNIEEDSIIDYEETK